MTAHSPATELPALMQALGRVRSRMRLGAALAVLLWTGAALLALALARHWLMGALAERFWTLAAIILATGAASLAVVLLGLPDRLVIARRADRRLAAGERFSTAMEVARAAAADPVSRALYRDAEAQAGSADFAAMAPLWRRGATIALVALGMLFAGGAAGLWLSRPLPDAGTEAPPPGQPAPFAVADLEALAELIGADAALYANPYLQAVSESVGDIAADSTASPEQVSAELGDVLAHARLAYGQSPPAWLDTGGAATAAGLQQVVDAAAGTLAARREAEAAAEQAYVPPDAVVDNLRAAPRGRSGSLVDETADDEANSTVTELAEPGNGGDAGETAAQRQSVELDDAGELQLEAGNAAAANASAQAAGGASPRAGEGTTALTGDDAFAKARLSPSGEVLLPSRPDNTGGRIRIEVAVDPRFTGVQSGGFGGGTDAGGLKEALVHRDTVLSHQRPAIARYFDRQQALGS